MLRVAVKLRDAPGRIGDYLADVTALEAAGADSIWLDTRTAAIEPWVLLGAIAAVTHRVHLGSVLVPRPGCLPP
ncbi:MAG: LLM class flavin-dependent oxidoreductase [Candidatus Dormibacteraceae bacterium]